jgi:hypothetical protein
VRAEKVDPELSYISFPPPTEQTAEIPFELPEFALAHPMYAEGEARVEFWVNKPYQDLGIQGFDCGFIADEFAGFATHNALTIWPHRRGGTDVTTVPFQPIGAIETICVAGQATFLLSKSIMQIIPFNRFEPTSSLPLPVSGPASMTVFRDGVVIGFPAAQALLAVNAHGEQQSIAIPFRGVKSIIGIGEHLVCGVPNSCVIRRITGTGCESGVFVGHCGAVVRIDKFAERTFASYGQDDTVRVWDAEDRALLATIVLGHVTLVALAGSSDFVICGLQSRRIAVADIRKGAAAFGVQTQEFLPTNMLYCAASDVLFVFAVHEADPSVIFADAERRKTVFRKYQRFTAERRTYGL